MLRTGNLVKKIQNPEFRQEFSSEIEFLPKTQNLCQKWNYFVKTRNLHIISKFRSKIELLVKNQNFGKKSKFDQKSEF